MRVLVVDDEEQLRTLLTDMLPGHDVVTAVNGVHACRVLKRRSFDLLISDWNMPEMDGIALARAVRQRRAAASRLPIILMSGEPGEAEIAAGRDVDVVLGKPFKLDDLHRAVGNVMAIHAERRVRVSRPRPS